MQVRVRGLDDVDTWNQHTDRQRPCAKPGANLQLVLAVSRLVQWAPPLLRLRLLGQALRHHRRLAVAVVAAVAAVVVAAVVVVVAVAAVVPPPPVPPLGGSQALKSVATNTGNYSLTEYS